MHQNQHSQPIFKSILWSIKIKYSGQSEHTYRHPECCLLNHLMPEAILSPGDEVEDGTLLVVSKDPIVLHRPQVVQLVKLHLDIDFVNYFL